MVNKKFYITIEVTAQMHNETAKNTSENRDKYRRSLMQLYNSMKTKLDYGFYIHNENVVCIYDEKGNAI